MDEAERRDLLHAAYAAQQKSRVLTEVDKSRTEPTEAVSESGKYRVVFTPKT